MKEQFEEIKSELEEMDKAEMLEAINWIRAQLVEIEFENASYVEFLERQGNIKFGSDK